MSEHKPLGREAILAFKVKRDVETIHTKLLGDVRVRRISHAISGASRNYPRTVDSETAMFILSVLNEDGSPMFSMTEEDIQEVEALPTQAIREVYLEIVKLNTAAISEELKNSPASPTTDSPTDSAPISA